MQMALDYEAVMLKSCQKSDAVKELFSFLKTEESQILFAQTGVGSSALLRSPFYVKTRHEGQEGVNTQLDHFVVVQV